MLQSLMAAQKGSLKKEDDEHVGTIGEDSADADFYEKHMNSKKASTLSKTHFNS